MSDVNNGTVASGTTGSEFVSRIAESHAEKPKGKKKPERTGFYARMAKHCHTRKFSLKGSDGQGDATVTLATFPALTRQGVEESAAEGVTTTYKPYALIDGIRPTANGKAEGEEGTALVAGFFEDCTQDAE